MKILGMGTGALLLVATLLGFGASGCVVRDRPVVRRPVVVERPVVRERVWVRP
ncbi:MAG TPA: hypothetical protein VHB21_17495 [Minicystis sp.]|nr:hypothetical protein [Minicystis sp.]